MHFGVEVSPIQFMNVFCEVTRRHIVPKTFWAEVNAHRLWLQNAHPGIVQGAGVVSGFDVFPPKRRTRILGQHPAPDPFRSIFRCFFGHAAYLDHHQIARSIAIRLPTITHTKNVVNVLRGVRHSTLYVCISMYACLFFVCLVT